MVRPAFTAFIALAMLAISAGSARSADSPPAVPAAQEGDPQKAELQDWERSLPSQRVPALVFPGATVVKAFGGKVPLQIGTDGTATTSRVLPNGRTEETKADGGEALSPAEIKILRNSVFYAPPPPAIPACCLPRHGFVFFDAAGHYVGNLKVCFQCGCAVLDPAPPHDPSQNWLVWDKDAIRRILEAHHLPIVVPPG